MLATYYQIIKESTNEIVDEGIIRNSEDTIYPGENTGLIDELPSECEAHKFKAKGYKINICNFTIGNKTIVHFRTTGDRIITS
jgi:hypothetical protein